MKLISSEFIRNIAPQLDLLNTIGGGVAQPQMRLEKRAKGVVMRVTAPTVSPESLHVVLNDQRLTVYGEYRHQPEDEMAAPLFVQNLDLPRNLDLTRIDAVHVENELRIRIPFNDTTNEQREIDIRRA